VRMKSYQAPWSKLLIGISALLTILCLGIGVVVTQRSNGALWWLAWLPSALAIGCALFTVRGYTITPDAILVHRLLWKTTLSRAGLESARFLPNAAGAFGRSVTEDSSPSPASIGTGLSERIGRM
jgi:hypothetical protein